MKWIKKILIGLFSLVVIFSVAFMNVFAIHEPDFEYDVGRAIKLVGTSTRTNGAYGIRMKFQSSSFYYRYVYIDNVISECHYGALIAFGEANKTDIINAYKNNTTINDYSILVGMTDMDETDYSYTITLVNVPEDFFTQSVTVLPFDYFKYVNTGAWDYGFSDSLYVKSLAESTLKAAQNGVTGTNITTIINSLSLYKKSYQDAKGNSICDEAIYESNPLNIYAQFAKDWNTFKGSQVIDPTTPNYNTMVQSLSAGRPIFSDDDILNQFFDEYTNWQWLLNYFYNSSVIDNYAKYNIYLIQNGPDSTCGATLWECGEKLVKALYNFFTMNFTDYDTNKTQYDTFYGNILNYNNVIYSNLSGVTLIKVSIE